MKQLSVASSPAIGPALIGGTVGLAVVLWAGAAPLASRVADNAAILKSIANIAAFTGTVLYCWSLILSARWLWTDRLFQGLDKVYKWHHITGGVSFLLLTLHALFLSIRLFGINPSRVASLWLITDNWQVNFGSLALYSVAILLLVTVFGRLKHETFVWLHRFLGAVFFLGFLHAVLAGGNMYRFWPLNYYMIGLMLIAIYAFLYHSVFGLFLPKRYKYEVDSVQQLGKDHVEIILRPLGRLMNFVPGQFAYLSFHGASISPEAHPFSMASGSRDKNLRFVTKTLGDYTATLSALRPKTQALIEGPHGGFSYKHTRNRSQIWIAGGIGVTPFLSMVRSLSPGYQIDFYYCVASMNDAHFDQEFQQIARAYPGLRVHTFCQDKEGFLTAELLQKNSDLSSRDVFICGPPPMMQAMHGGLLKAGVPDKQIHFEDFSFH